MKGRLVSETVNRSRDATAEVNEFLRVTARDANDGSFAEKAAEYCDIADYAEKSPNLFLSLYTHN